MVILACPLPFYAVYFFVRVIVITDLTNTPVGYIIKTNGKKKIGENYGKEDRMLYKDEAQIGRGRSSTYRQTQPY